MSQPTPAGSATATRTPAPAIGRVVHANRSTAELYEDALRAGEGMIAADGPLVVRTGKHTGRSPKDKFVVREPSSARQGLVGRGQPADQRGALRPAPGPARRYVASRPLYAQDCHIGAHPDHRRSLRVYTETAWASIFARNLFRRPSADRTSPPSARTSRSSTCPSFKADPATEGTRSETAILRPSQADGGDHRRHRVRRRDQEVGLHGHELPAPRRGRPADALGGQRRRGARLRRVLRPVGNRQDDALGRSRAEPDRRRRARLGRRRRVQLRGRLLRQDDPPLADVRAGHLRRRRSASGRSSRTSSSTRGRGRSTSTPTGSPRTPAAPTRSSSSATPTRPGSPASRRTSCC